MLSSWDEDIRSRSAACWGLRRLDKRPQTGPIGPTEGSNRSACEYCMNGRANGRAARQVGRRAGNHSPPDHISCCPDCARQADTIYTSVSALVYVRLECMRVRTARCLLYHRELRAEVTVTRIGKLSELRCARAICQDGGAWRLGGRLVRRGRGWGRAGQSRCEG